MPGSIFFMKNEKVAQGHNVTWWQMEGPGPHETEVRGLMARSQIQEEFRSFSCLTTLAGRFIS
eukprot:COSAG03_NODE_52_length_16230_cov_22.987168_24_plen_63_part_00